MKVVVEEVRVLAVTDIELVSSGGVVLHRFSNDPSALAYFGRETRLMSMGRTETLDDVVLVSCQS
jgi:hypothetical protein